MIDCSCLIFVVEDVEDIASLPNVKRAVAMYVRAQTANG